MFDAATALLIIAAADPEGTRGILYWLFGSLAGSTWGDLAVAVPLLVVAGAVVLAQARPLNAMAIGDDDAAAVGVDVSRVRWLLLVTGALLTGALVAVSGAIGFVGLLLPHATRLVVGRDHRFLLPAVALAGATFLVGVDTALIGAPAFAFLLARRMGARSSPTRGRAARSSPSTTRHCDGSSFAPSGSTCPPSTTRVCPVM